MSLSQLLQLNHTEGQGVQWGGESKGRVTTQSNEQPPVSHNCLFFMSFTHFPPSLSHSSHTPQPPSLLHLAIHLLHPPIIPLSNKYNLFFFWLILT